MNEDLNKKRGLVDQVCALSKRIAEEFLKVRKETGVADPAEFWVVKNDEGKYILEKDTTGTTQEVTVGVPMDEAPRLIIDRNSPNRIYTNVYKYFVKTSEEDDNILWEKNIIYMPTLETTFNYFTAQYSEPSVWYGGYKMEDSIGSRTLINIAWYKRIFGGVVKTENYFKY